MGEIDWERVIQRCYRQSTYRTEWCRIGQDSLFLLAWKGRRVELVFVDLLERLGEATIPEVREEFLNLLSRLCKRARWKRIFKGRDVLFKWLVLEGISERGRRILRLVGVEPFPFLEFWESGEGGRPK